MMEFYGFSKKKNSELAVGDRILKYDYEKNASRIFVVIGIARQGEWVYSLYLQDEVTRIVHLDDRVINDTENTVFEAGK